VIKLDVNERIRRDLIENLRWWRDSLCAQLGARIDRMEEAETVEEIMAIKKEILLDLIENMPLSYAYCYFCLMLITKCYECPYMKHHGACNDDGSTWRNIIRAKTRLTLALEDYYREGEEYEYNGG